MRLSEAIRLGSMATRKVVGKFTDGNGGYCAMGASIFAAGAVPDDGNWALALITQWPFAHDLVILPCRCNDHDSLSATIYHLNDEYGWSRESIADWVATVEPQAEPVAADPITVPVAL